MDTLKTIVRIAGHTVSDQVRQKSLLVIFVICGFIVLGIRNCYQGDYVINDQQVSAASFALGASKGMFNFVATVAMIIAALLAMRLYKRERSDGTQSAVLSKPVSRYEYIAGKAAGLWAVAFVFMFALHGIIFAIGLIKTGEAVPGFLLASLLCSINILFVIFFVMLLSLYMPDFACFIVISAIGVFGHIGDGVYSIATSDMARSLMEANAAKLPDISVWKVLYLALPKLSTVQSFASSFIENNPFDYAGPIHPMINIGVYCVAAIAGLLVLFRKQDIG